MEEKIHLGDIDLSKNQELPLKYLCVDIDCLFDTRLPMACMIDPEGMNKMLTENKYIWRRKDNLGNIPEMTFKMLYTNRTKHIMEVSKPTIMIDFVRETFADMAYDTTRLAYDFDVGIFVNMYPYDFNQAELDSLMIMFNNVFEGIDVKFINKSIKELDPKFVRKNIGILIKYDMLYWLEYHTAMQNIFECHIFDSTLIGPMLAMGNVKNKDINPEYFKRIKQHHNKIANIDFLPAFMFSYSEESIDWRKMIEDAKEEKK